MTSNTPIVEVRFWRGNQIYPSSSVHMETNGHSQAKTKLWKSNRQVENSISPSLDKIGSFSFSRDWLQVDEEWEFTNK